MKLEVKKKIKSSEELADDTQTEILDTESDDCQECEYDDALDYIRSAIDSLSGKAKSGDVLAKQTIANLGVVILDLQ